MFPMCSFLCALTFEIIIILTHMLVYAQHIVKLLALYKPFIIHLVCIKYASKTLITFQHSICLYFHHLTLVLHIMCYLLPTFGHYINHHNDYFYALIPMHNATHNLWNPCIFHIFLSLPLCSLMNMLLNSYPTHIPILSIVCTLLSYIYIYIYILLLLIYMYLYIHIHIYT